MRRTLLLAAVILSALLLQTTVFADVLLLGAKPELLYLLTIVFAFLDGPSAGAITAGSSVTVTSRTPAASKLFSTLRRLPIR